MDITINNITLSAEALYNIYADNKYLVTHNKIYQLHYSGALKGNMYGSIIYRGSALTEKNTYKTLSADEVNTLIGFNLLNTDI